MLGFTSRYISSFRKNTNTKIFIWNYFSIFETLLSISQGSSDYTYPVRQFLRRTYTWLLIFCYNWKKLSCISPLGCFPFILITHLIFSIGIRSPPNEMSAPAPSVWRKKLSSIAIHECFLFGTLNYASNYLYLGTSASLSRFWASRVLGFWDF